jgi:hypothetical protein
MHPLFVYYSMLNTLISTHSIAFQARHTYFFLRVKENNINLAKLHKGPRRKSDYKHTPVQLEHDDDGGTALSVARRRLCSL